MFIKFIFSKECFEEIGVLFLFVTTIDDNIFLFVSKLVFVDFEGYLRNDFFICVFGVVCLSIDKESCPVSLGDINSLRHDGVTLPGVFIFILDIGVSSVEFM